MKTLALVSGGKDSCFNIMECERHGHEVVALANLLPQQAEVDELDSFMFQTVGHQVVESFSSCTGLPLFRRRITGSAQHQRLAYRVTDGDEVEDLHALVAYAKEAMPELEAVGSGAIASDYQRLRVENVCSRLGLVSLSYLWHRPQSVLLRQMIDAGIHAILIKVAALGLDPHCHLGRSLQDIQGHLLKIRDRYGCNPCGEGGEFETLVLDCPAFREAKIVLEDSQVRLHSPDAVASVGVLHACSFHLQTKRAGAPVPEGRIVMVPDDWRPPGRAAGTASSVEVGSSVTTSVEVRTSGSMAVLRGRTAGSQQGCQAAAEAAEKMLAHLGQEMEAAGLRWKDALLVRLALADISAFKDVNQVYCRFFPSTDPASRVCVQLPLPHGSPLALDVVLATPQLADAVPRRVLHVQSVSDWAPSCIGPYSQGVRFGGLVRMAGQIPLDPGTMAVPPGASTARQAGLCLAHCRAAATALRCSLQDGALAMTVYCVDPDTAAPLLQQAAGFLEGVLNEEAMPYPPHPDEGELGQDEDGSRYVDDYLVAENLPRTWRPLLLALVVPRLPRDVQVEVHPLICCGADVAASDAAARDVAEAVPRPATDTPDGQELGPHLERLRLVASEPADSGTAAPGWIGRLRNLCILVPLAEPAVAADWPGSLQLLRAEATASRHPPEMVVARVLAAAGELALVTVAVTRVQEELQSSCMLAGVKGLVAGLLAADLAWSQVLEVCVFYQADLGEAAVLHSLEAACQHHRQLHASGHMARVVPDSLSAFSLLPVVEAVVPEPYPSGTKAAVVLAMHATRDQLRKQG